MNTLETLRETAGKSSSRRVDLHTAAKALKEKESKQSLYMSRVPQKTLVEFRKISKEEFNDDYGLTLAFLVERYRDLRVLVTLMQQVNQLHSLFQEIVQHGAELAKQNAVREKTTFSGRTIKGRQRK